MKKQIFLFLALILASNTYSQSVPEEFYDALDLQSEGYSDQAKDLFFEAADIDSTFYGTYHFLGVIYQSEDNLDSAIYYYKKAIALNTNNRNHTHEMTYIRLINAYLFQLDFDQSFNTALEANKLYPESNQLQRELLDLCLWSFYIKYNELDSSYLSPDIKDEYIVNSISEEYLIIRKLRIDGSYLQVNKQALISKDEANYDILTCSISKSDETIDINFRINWNMATEFGGKTADTKAVYSNYKNPIHEILGAMLIDNRDIKIMKTIKKIQKKQKKLK